MGMSSHKLFVRHIKQTPIVEQIKTPDCLKIDKSRRRGEPSKNHSDDAPRVSECQYPGKGEKLEFCGAPTDRGKSYCEHHHKICHQKLDPNAKRANFTFSMIGN